MTARDPPLLIGKLELVNFEITRGVATALTFVRGSGEQCKITTTLAASKNTPTYDPPQQSDQYIRTGQGNSTTDGALRPEDK